MLIVPPPTFLGAGGAGLPVATLTAASFFGGGAIGYAAPGGWLDGDGSTGGSLSTTLYPGLVTTDVYEDSIFFNCMVVFFSGNRVSALAGITGIKINGVEYDLTDGPDYYSGNGLTMLGFESSSISGTGTYTVQLLGA